MLSIAGYFYPTGLTMIQHKTFAAEIQQKGDAGGRIVISTCDVDRDRDRVMPRGAVLENYMNNPVVMWGHSYANPADVIGKTTHLEITDTGIVADFELRPAANEADPQNIVRLLWDGGWIRTASIGFRPLVAEPNEYGGNDFKQWELLEWSVIPIPANQSALRLAAKALDAFGAVEPGAQGYAPDEQKDAAPDGDTPAAVVDAPPVDSDGKQDGIGNDSDGAADAVPDADAINAIEAAQELRLAAILADFVSAIRPYLAVE